MESQRQAFSGRARARAPLSGLTGTVRVEGGVASGVGEAAGSRGAGHRSPVAASRGGLGQRQCAQW